MSRIHITRGADETIDLSVRGPDGQLLNLDGAELVWQAHTEEGVLTLDKNTGSGITHAADQSTTGKGLATVSLDRTETDDLPAEMTYSLWIIDSLGERHPVVEHGGMSVAYSAAVIP